MFPPLSNHHHILRVDPSDHSDPGVTPPSGSGNEQAQCPGLTFQAERLAERRQTARCSDRFGSVSRTWQGDSAISLEGVEESVARFAQGLTAGQVSLGLVIVTGSSL